MKKVISTLVIGSICMSSGLAMQPNIRPTGETPVENHSALQLRTVPISPELFIRDGKFSQHHRVVDSAGAPLEGSPIIDAPVLGNPQELALARELSALREENTLLRQMVEQLRSEMDKFKDIDAVKVDTTHHSDGRSMWTVVRITLTHKGREFPLNSLSMNGHI